MEQFISFDIPDFISGFETTVAEKIKDGIYVPESDLIIVTADIYDEDGHIIFTTAKLLYKETFNKLNLKKHYELRTEEDELIQMADIRKITEYGFVDAKLYTKYRKKYNWDIDFNGGFL